MKEILEKISNIKDIRECSTLIIDYVENQYALCFTRPDQKEQIVENINMFFDELILLNLDKQNYHNILTWLAFTDYYKISNEAYYKLRTFLKLKIN